MRLGRDTKIVESKCTACGKMLDGVTGIDCDTGPSSGDITVCFSCGHIMAFDDDLLLRDLTEAEQIAVAGDERIVKFNDIRAKVMAEVQAKRRIT